MDLGGKFGDFWAVLMTVVTKVEKDDEEEEEEVRALLFFQLFVAPMIPC